MSVVNLDSAELASELKGWGGPNEMSAFEGVMWRAEANPKLRSTITSVLLLDGIPDWSRFYAAHEWVVATVPRFRQRVVEPALGLGNPVWVDEPFFRLDYHVRRISLPAPGSLRQLMDFAQIQAMTPFEKARSPWEATLVEGLDGNRAAYILKIHHSTSDGMGIIQLLSRILSKTDKPSKRSAPALDLQGVKAAPSPVSVAVSQLAKNAASVPGRASAVAERVSGALGSAWRSKDDRKKTREYLESVKRVMGIKPVEGSGLFKKRSLSWRFDALDFPLDEFKAGAKAAGGSVNDAFIAALLGGFRLYHEELGVPIKEIPIGFPISLRNENDPMGGNKIAGTQYAGQVAETDPVKRIQHIRAFVRKIKNEPALDVMVKLMPAISRLPLPAISAFMEDYVKSQDAQVSNVPGIPFDVYLAGKRVTHFYPCAPAPGCGMMITMTSHNGVCCVGVNTDQAAVTEPELLMACFRKGVQEIIELGERSAG